MTSVTLTRLWLTRATNQADALVLDLQAGSTEAWEPTTETRLRAGGRIVGVTRPGLGRTWTPVLRQLLVPTVRDLQARAGTLHWARDPWGGRVGCLWDAPLVTWQGWAAYVDDQVATVSLTLREVTYQEVE